MAEILKQILKMSKVDRWTIAMKILDSIRDEETGLSEEQWDELEKRIKRVESGKIKPLSEEEFWAGLDRKKA